MAKPGRKPVLDEAKLREVVALASLGCKIHMAARYVGCSKRTVEREFEKNEDFRERLIKAQVGSQATPLDALRKAAGTHWRAAAWLLERGFPDEFGRHPSGAVPVWFVKNFISRIIQAVASAFPDPEVRRRIRRSIHRAFREEVEQRSEPKRCRERSHKNDKPITLRGLDHCREQATRCCQEAESQRRAERKAECVSAENRTPSPCPLPRGVGSESGELPRPLGVGSDNAALPRPLGEGWGEGAGNCPIGESAKSGETSIANGVE